MTTTSTAGRTGSQPVSPGTKNNQLAIGMRVKVIARGMAQSDEVHSGGSYLSQNELRLHFVLSTRPNRSRRKSLALWKTGHTHGFSRRPVPFRYGRDRRRSALKVSVPIPRLSPNSQQAPQSLPQPAGRPWRPTSLAMNRAHLLFFPKCKISTEGPFALKKRLLHFLFAATPPHVSLAGGPKRGFEPP